jgi:hypothetical protein
MYEVAPLPKNTGPLGQKHSAFLRFVFGVEMLIFFELMQAMGEFASFLIGTLPEFQIFLAELRLFFFFPHRRFGSMSRGVVARRGGVLR